MSEVRIASCQICGHERELAIWVDPSLTGGTYHGVCFNCRNAAQQKEIEEYRVAICPICGGELIIRPKNMLTK